MDTNILIIINDAPYGTEKAYNAFRLANQLLKDYDVATVNIFLLADGVGCGISNQQTPNGFYNIGRMIKLFTTKGGKLKACGSCMDARGLQSIPLIDAVERGTMEELAQWTVEANKVVTF